MAEVHTPFDQRLDWNPTGSFPAVATAVHGTYHVTGTGPRYDVYYKTFRDGVEETAKLASDLNARNAYRLCVDHNRVTLGVVGLAGTQGRPKSSRPEPTCADCGLVHQGECW